MTALARSAPLGHPWPVRGLLQRGPAARIRAGASGRERGRAVRGAAVGPGFPPAPPAAGGPHPTLEAGRCPGLTPHRGPLPPIYPRNWPAFLGVGRWSGPAPLRPRPEREAPARGCPQPASASQPGAARKPAPLAGFLPLSGRSRPEPDLWTLRFFSGRGMLGGKRVPSPGGRRFRK